MLANSGDLSYKLAEKLSDRLDEMGKDLKSMIEEINSASLTLNKANKPDDPVSFRLGERICFDLSRVFPLADGLSLALSNRQNP